MLLEMKQTWWLNDFSAELAFAIISYPYISFLKICCCYQTREKIRRKDGETETEAETERKLKLT
jgi:hypothetical protein